MNWRQTDLALCSKPTDETIAGKGRRPSLGEKSRVVSGHIIPPLYVLSLGPVAWAANDAEHPAYLPEQVMCIYAPLGLLCANRFVDNAFEHYVIDVWHGFPYGYTTD